MDVREFLFKPLLTKRFLFKIQAKEAGILSGISELHEQLKKMDLEITSMLAEGACLSPGTSVLQAIGNAESVARAEEILLGAIGKASGIATISAKLVSQAGKIKVVCGAWKKVNIQLRPQMRQAASTGGVAIRMVEEPFVYLDKNYVRMLGGIGAAVAKAKQFDPSRLVVVQLRGEEDSMAEEARIAFSNGAGILMVDTGNYGDLSIVNQYAQTEGWRSKVKLAFAGGVTAGDLAELEKLGADIVDVGRAILDAPTLDFSLDVERGNDNGMESIRENDLLD